MTIITKYTKKDFDELLKKYGIGKYKSHKHIEFALENTVYIFSTNKGKYVLKIFEWLKLDKIRFQLEVEEYLYSKGVKIPEVVLSKAGKDLLIFKGKPVCISRFLTGRHVNKLSDALCKDLGRSIGKMHKALLNLKIKNRKNWALADKLIQVHRKIFNAPKGFMQQEYDRLLKEVKTIKCSKLRKSIIHGDLHFINYLVERNKVKAILDWGDMHKNYISYDLAVFFAHMMLDLKGLKKKKLNLFMKEYSKYVKLNEEEKKSLLAFMKVRIMSVLFWHNMMIKKHKDQAKHLRKTIKYYTKKYAAVDKISKI